MKTVSAKNGEAQSYFARVDFLISSRFIINSGKNFELQRDRCRTTFSVHYATESVSRISRMYEGLCGGKKEKERARERGREGGKGGGRKSKSALSRAAGSICAYAAEEGKSSAKRQSHDVVNRTGEVGRYAAGPSFRLSYARSRATMYVLVKVSAPSWRTAIGARSVYLGRATYPCKIFLGNLRNGRGHKVQGRRGEIPPKVSIHTPCLWETRRRD